VHLVPLISGSVQDLKTVPPPDDLVLDTIMQLQIHGRTLDSFYGLLGKDERALTFALAHAFTQSPEFLGETLREVGMKHVRRRALSRAVVKTEEFKDDRTFTDIEILCPPEYPEIHVIFEAKIGNMVPEQGQLETYLQRFKKGHGTRCLLVTLLASGDEKEVYSYGLKNVTCLTWAQISDLCQKVTLREQESWRKFWLEELSKFIERDYSMKSYEEEVWIVSTSAVNTVWSDGPTWSELPFKNKVYFYPRKARRSIYMAFRVKGQVTHIFKIIDRSRSLVTKVQGLEKTSTLDWAQKEIHWVYKLGDPVKLPHPTPCHRPAFDPGRAEIL